MQQLTSGKLELLRGVLLNRQKQLNAEVREGSELLSGTDSFAEQAGEASDAGDASVALEVQDLRNAEIARDLAELRSIDVALARIESGDYGSCSTCGKDIPLARLVASPTAERCIQCQTLYESTHNVQTRSSM
ncbi:hypothetical protein BH09PSE5_BH09PSE5_50880 [soil metagenome]